MMGESSERPGLWLKFRCGCLVRMIDGASAQLWLYRARYTTCPGCADEAKRKRGFCQGCGRAFGPHLKQVKRGKCARCYLLALRESKTQREASDD